MVLLDASYVPRSIPSQLVDEKGLTTCSFLNLYIALRVHDFFVTLSVFLNTGERSSR